MEPTIIENIVFTISKEGYLFVIDKLTGNILRSTNILQFNKKNNIFPTGFIVTKNFIYVSLNNGRLVEINIANGKAENTIKIDKDKISRPYILNKNMYILKNNSVVKIY